MRIGIIADDPAAAAALTRVILSVEGAEVAWTAGTGSRAAARCRSAPVDRVLLDMGVRERGVDVVGRLRKDTPCPLSLVTLAGRGHAPDVLDCLKLAAVDAVVAPVARDGAGAGAEELASKLRAAKRDLDEPRRERRRRRAALVNPPLVVLGASTGGPDALAVVLAALPSNLAAPVVVVQHLDARFTDGLVAWLARSSALPPVRVARGARPDVGRVHVASGDAHVTLDAAGCFQLSSAPAELPYRPSVDVFFASAARHWTGGGAAALLTGLGRDGAAGLLALRGAGWHTIAQNPATSAVGGMPREAARLGAAREVLPLAEIAPALLRGLPARRAEAM